MLSDAEVQRYREDGYIVPDYRLEQARLDEIRDAHDRLLRRHPQFSDYCPSLLAYDFAFLNVARDEALLDMVEQLIGPDIALWNMSFFAKPARCGSKTPWHQDGEYWPIRPIATCSVWIAIDASTPENGCLRVIRGSHREGKLLRHRTNSAEGLSLSQELEDDQYDENEAADIVLEPGQLSLHDVFLVHGSEANRSAKPRRGMTLRLMPTSSYYDRELAAEQYRRFGKADHGRRSLFLLRGTDVCGRNDFRLRS